MRYSTQEQSMKKNLGESCLGERGIKSSLIYSTSMFLTSFVVFLCINSNGACSYLMKLLFLQLHKIFFIIKLNSI